MATKPIEKAAMCDGPLGDEDDGSVVTFATSRLKTPHSTNSPIVTEHPTVSEVPAPKQSCSAPRRTSSAQDLLERADAAADATIAGTVLERGAPRRVQAIIQLSDRRGGPVTQSRSTAPNLGFHPSWPAIRFRLLRRRLLSLPRPRSKSHLGPVETAPVANNACAITRQSALLGAPDPHSFECVPKF